MLVAIYHILKDGVVFKDLEAGYYNQFNRERKINAYLKKLKTLGWEAPVVATYVFQSSLKTAKKLDRGSLSFFGYPEGIVSK